MKYYIWALGCAMNKSDAERIASVLSNADYTKTREESEADIIVTVACSVRQHAIDRIYGKVEKWNEMRAKRPLITILSGCVLEADRKKMKRFFDLIFDIKELQKLKQFLEQNTKSETLNPKQYQNKNDKNIKDDALNFENWDLFRNSKLEIRNCEDYLSINPIRESSFMAYVPISTGCDNFCTYCAVPYTRGREVSRPAEEIITEVRELIEKGYKEITLLGQNVNSYGFTQKNRRTKQQNNNPVIYTTPPSSLSEAKDLRDSSGSALRMTNNFVKLIKEIDKIPGIYRVYFYSNHPKDLSNELIETIPKTIHFPHYIHLPLQSGSDKILKAMNRHYTQENYIGLVKKIKDNVPQVAITTDIIVGFPGETKKDFEETKKVVKEVGFGMIYIGKFSPRPGTIAAKLKDNVPKEEKERRWQELTGLLKAHLEKENKSYIGSVMKVLIDSEKKGKYYGRTDNYKVVEIDNPVILSRTKNLRDPSLTLEDDKAKQTNLIGQFVNIEITDSSAWMLKGEILH
ncbi:MiaB/RimO family radical SAM methylthiotransferase [candidate division WS5 bacterium]|uniref:tRNA-2-methylthio-N(6)-dimethylallyladenosine synthase n=1 Tax=candidate division WS5 bacterium TaxID=2093353 RepID=A0A419DAR3_9BACT|nr:MAG: MiaB/RimO family radical SAM methylthiotransferase [candidate division WS5 bacterium]